MTPKNCLICNFTTIYFYFNKTTYITFKTNIHVALLHDHMLQMAKSLRQAAYTVKIQKQQYK